MEYAGFSTGWLSPASAQLNNYCFSIGGKTSFSIFFLVIPQRPGFYQWALVPSNLGFCIKIPSVISRSWVEMSSTFLLPEQTLLVLSLFPFQPGTGTCILTQIHSPTFFSRLFVLSTFSSSPILVRLAACLPLPQQLRRWYPPRALD